MDRSAVIPCRAFPCQKWQKTNLKIAAANLNQSRLSTSRDRSTSQSCAMLRPFMTLGLSNGIGKPSSASPSRSSVKNPAWTTIPKLLESYKSQNPQQPQTCKPQYRSSKTTAVRRPRRLSTAQTLSSTSAAKKLQSSTLKVRKSITPTRANRYQFD